MSIDLTNVLAPALTVVAVVIGLIVLLSVVRRATRLYHRVPPNKVMVVYGRGKTQFDENSKPTRTGVRLVTGGGVLVWPVLEDFGYLDLNVMTIAVERDEVYTIDGIPIRLDWVVQAQVDSDEVSLLTAARAFLGMERHEVKGVIAETLSTNNRAIVGQLTVEEVHRDRDAFVQRVQELAADEMAAMGVRIVSMGVKEITDDKGYFTAMAAPQIAVVKRDAKIAEAEADREARVKAAEAHRAAEEAELDARTKIIQQQEALKLREVAQERTVQLAKADSEREVQEQRALVVEKQQEVDLLVPARAKRAAELIEADAKKQTAEIDADADAAVKLKQAEAEAEFQRRKAAGDSDAKRTVAQADADATRARAEAHAEEIRQTKTAEAEGTKATLEAEAEGSRAKGLAEAEATKARLLAEAEGKQKIADATAAQGEINLRQAIAEALIEAEVKKAEAISMALAGVGENVRIVQFDGQGQNGSGALQGLLTSIPELATVLNAKTEALSDGDNIEQVLERVLAIVRTAGTVQSSEEDSE